MGPMGQGGARGAGHDTRRRALRSALPALLVGFMVWMASVGIHALAGIDFARSLAERLALERVAAVVGALASGIVLVGAAQLARARLTNRPIPSALAFFALWLAELVLRLWMLATGEESFDVLALRVLLANLAMVSLSRAMLVIHPTAGRAPRSWLLTQRGFGLQLCLGVLLAIALRTGLLAPSAPLSAALWLLLIAPYVHAYLSLQRTARELAATETVAEFLTR
jgi:hypothetical protein